MSNFTFTETKIKGVYIIDVKTYGDHRGYFMETYKELMEAEEYDEVYDEEEFTMDPDDFDQQLAEEAFAEEVQGLDDSDEE